MATTLEGLNFVVQTPTIVLKRNDFCHLNTKCSRDSASITKMCFKHTPVFHKLYGTLRFLPHSFFILFLLKTDCTFPSLLRSLNEMRRDKHLIFYLMQLFEINLENYLNWKLKRLRKLICKNPLKKIAHSDSVDPHLIDSQLFFASCGFRTCDLHHARFP
jgi:hypothetical protein